MLDASFTALTIGRFDDVSMTKTYTDPRPRVHGSDRPPDGPCHCRRWPKICVRSVAEETIR
jgi:hypothetical protein